MGSGELVLPPTESLRGLPAYVALKMRRTGLTNFSSTNVDECIESFEPDDVVISVVVDCIAPGTGHVRGLLIAHDTLRYPHPPGG